MGGGQTSTTNSTNVTNQTPWAPSWPMLMQGLNDSQTLYQEGVGNQIYQGQRVADLTPMQQGGIQSISDQAAADNSAGIALTGLQNIVNSNGGVSYNGPALNSDGLSAGTQGAVFGLQGVQGANLTGLNSFIGNTYGGNDAVNGTARSFMNGSNDITTTPLYQGLLAYNSGPAASETNLSDVAAGKYLDPTADPYLQAAVAASNQNVGNAQKEAFAASGRYGSGNFAAATAKAINDTDTGLYANQYNQERANQFAANQALDAARNNRISAGGTLANDITNVQGINNNQRLAGASLMQAENAQALDALNRQILGQQFNSNLDLTKAQGVLGAYQQGTQNAMTNATNTADTSLASQAQAIQAANSIPAVDASRYAPAAQLLQGGSVQQAQNQAYLDAAQQYFQDTQTVPWQALSQYMAFPTAIGSMGGTTVSQGTQQTHTSGPSIGQMLLGGLTSGLGLLSKSDERAKENIEPVGQLHDGQTVYRYNYKGEERPQIGLLAQEVQQTNPDAVAPMPGQGGLLGVDYGKATDKAADMAAGQKPDARQDAMLARAGKPDADAPAGGLLGVPAHAQMTVMMVAKPEGKGSKSSKGGKASKAGNAAPGMPPAMAQAVGQAVAGLLAGAGKKDAA